MTTQDAFIGRVTAALRPPDQHARNRKKFIYPTGSDIAKEVLNRIQRRSPAERIELLTQLIKQGKPLNLHVIPTKDISATATAIAELIEERSPEWGGAKSVAAWHHPLIDALDMKPHLTNQQVIYFPAIPVIGASGTDEDSAHLRRLERAFVGITSADYCLAETATLVIKTRPACARSVSLLPTIHVAVIELKQVIANLVELFALLKIDGKRPCLGLGNCLTMITGPSKTADIELTMVHGAHGPRELYLYIIAPEAVK
jgi:L-lactate dehydrogenase complex protein LldG